MLEVRPSCQTDQKCMSPEVSSCQVSPKDIGPGEGLEGHQLPGQGALQRRLDGAVQAVVGDEVAVAVRAGFLEPVEGAEELVVAAPERDVVADAGGLVGDLALDLGEEFLGRR